MIGKIGLPELLVLLAIVFSFLVPIGCQKWEKALVKASRISRTP